MRSLFIPHLNSTVKLARKRPDPNTPKLHLSKYLKNLPTPPSSCNYAPNAMQSLSQMYLNDQLGDCVIAAGYHIVGVETGNANGGTPFVATSAQITSDYSNIGGYVPGDPSTDQGADEQTALNWWTSKGFANGTKLSGWVAIDATNQQEVQQAMFLFENLLLGIELPDSWISPFPSVNGFTWDVGTPDPGNGHAICCVGYSAQGVYIDTWGLIGTITYAAIKELCVNSNGGELYVLLTPDQIAKGQAKAPNGVAWADLISDFIAMGGTIPAPPPVPTPPTPPAPPVPPPPVPVTPTLTSITIVPANSSANAGSSAIFTGFGTYSNGSKVNVSTSATWISSNTSVATVSGGLVHCLNAGVTNITCTLSGITGSAHLTVVNVAPVPSTVSLVQAQSWATSGLAKNWLNGTTVSLAQAEVWATQGLQSNWPHGVTIPTLAQAQAWAIQGLQSNWPISHR